MEKIVAVNQIPFVLVEERPQWSCEIFRQMNSSEDNRMRKQREEVRTTLSEDSEGHRVQKLGEEASFALQEDAKDDGTQQEGQIVPDDVVENILARMCYPGIFKVRALSKSWFSKFEYAEHLDDEKEKILANFFQKQMRELSGNWPSNEKQMLQLSENWPSRNCHVPALLWYLFVRGGPTNPREVAVDNEGW